MQELSKNDGPLKTLSISDELKDSSLAKTYNRRSYSGFLRTITHRKKTEIGFSLSVRIKENFNDFTSTATV